MLTHIGQKPDRFDFHKSNAEIIFQEIHILFWCPLFLNNFCFMSKSSKSKVTSSEIGLSMV